MKVLILSLILFIQQQFPQTAFYDWIGHDSNEIISAFGNPKAITPEGEDSLYIYETELGYSSFLINAGYVRKVNNTTYWDKESKAKEAMNELLGMYNKEGFNVDETSETISYLTNDIFLAKIRTYFDSGYYAVEETVSKLNKEDK